VTKHPQNIDSAAASRGIGEAGAPEVEILAMLVPGMERLGTIQGHGGRGLFVPHGYTVNSILAAERILERQFDVESCLARSMVMAILLAAEEASSESILENSG
jgi:hypothetical protein